MLQYVVSSHGGFYKDTKDFTIPPDVILEFYCWDKLTLGSPRALAIWHTLKSGGVITPPKETKVAGDTIPDYACWSMTPDYPGLNGVFVLDATPQLAANRVSNCEAVLPTKRLPLSVIVRDLRRKSCKAPMTLHWLCCRELDPNRNDPNQYLEGMPPA
jgi:hypothetical protein